MKRNRERIGQAAAVAALDNLAAFRPAIEAIRRERERATRELAARGFAVTPSQANFILARIPPGRRDGTGQTLAVVQVQIRVRSQNAQAVLARANAHLR